MKTISQLINNGESQTVEFKTSFKEEVIASVVAFANAQGGKIVIGVSDSGEIVLNMIVHRDYRDSSDSVIKIFDDRIEFFNPGDLYDGLTIEQLLSNRYKSKTRNKLIALMFKELGLIEKYGSGISRIKGFCKSHNIIEPKFEEKQKGFQVTLYKKKRDVGINELYDFIRLNQPIRISQIKEKFTTVTTRTIERWVKQLKDENKIEYIGSKKTGGYHAKEQ